MERARVLAVLSRKNCISEVLVRLKGKKEKARALNFEGFTGELFPGDRVVLNTTAIRLKLGSGGFHLVCFNYEQPTRKMDGRGHIMKMRYAPHQLRVFSCEEEGNCLQEIENFKSLEGSPVLVGELHSMLAPAVLALKAFSPAIRVGYIMTDSASLPLAMSKVVHQLKEKGLLHVSISCGQAFGGDLEAVNLYTGIIAAFALACVDVALISAGPGVVGTGTRFGFSGMELAENINRVRALGGTPLVIPRLSLQDYRGRHQGVSHHTLTPLSLSHVLPAYLPLPPLTLPERTLIMEQLKAYGIMKKHRVCSVVPYDPEKLSLEEEVVMETMGRKAGEDPLFFKAAAAAGTLAARMLQKRQDSINLT